MNIVNRILGSYWMPLYLMLGALICTLIGFASGQQALAPAPNLIIVLFLGLAFFSLASSWTRAVRLGFLGAGIALILLKVWLFFYVEVSTMQNVPGFWGTLTEHISILPFNVLMGMSVFLLVRLFSELSYRTELDRKHCIWTALFCLLALVYVSVGVVRPFFEGTEGFRAYSFTRLSPADAFLVQLFTGIYLLKAWPTLMEGRRLYRASVFLMGFGGALISLSLVAIEKQVFSLIQNQMENKITSIQLVLKNTAEERLETISVLGDFLNDAKSPTQLQVDAMVKKLSAPDLEPPTVFYFSRSHELKWVYQDGTFHWNRKAQEIVKSDLGRIHEKLKDSAFNQEYFSQRTAQGLTVAFVSPVYRNRRLAGFLYFEDLAVPKVRRILSKYDFSPFDVFIQTSDGVFLTETARSRYSVVNAQAHIDFFGEPLTLTLVPNRTLLVGSVLIPQIGFLAISLVIILFLNFVLYTNRRKVIDIEREVQDRVYELKLLKEEADQAKLEAEHASYSKSQFLANMSHEIRTPLNVLLGASELLSETKLSNEQKKYVDMFGASGKHLLSLLNDIIDLSRIESGHLELEKIPFDMKKTLEFVSRLFSVKAEEIGIQFVIDDKKLTNSLRKGDPLRIRQILVNLVGNALKFTKHGFVKISVFEEPDHSLLFVVEDTGPGIANDKQAQIFETFNQGDLSFSRKHGGAGLGLAISKNLVELMGGEISLESEPGVGSKFLVRLPLLLATEAEVHTQKTDTEEAPALSPTASDSISVLLVDDSEDNRFLVKLFLDKKQFHVVEAKNGEEAVNLVKQKSFDIVLMDMQMPVMDGYEATKIIRQFESQRGQAPHPILALTAHGTVAEKNRCLEIGCTDYLSKPVSKNNLLNRIYSLTNKNEPPLSAST